MCNRNTQCCLRHLAVSRKRQKTDHIPKCCSDGLSQMLVELTTLFNNCDLHYWLDWGALLGIYRSGELIPYDGDLDIGIFNTDRKKLPIKEMTEMGYHYCPSNCMSYSGMRSAWPRVFFSKKNLLFCDINTWQIDGKRAIGCGRYNEGVPSHYIKLSTLEYKGATIKIPSDTEQYLQLRYGPDWKTPDPFFYQKGGHKIRRAQYDKQQKQPKIL